MRIDIRYATADDGVRLAWTVLGSGPATPLVAMRPPQFSHLEREWGMNYSHHEFEAFTSTRPVLRFDPRGTGLSDRGCEDQSVDRRAADLATVIDAAGFERVVLDAISAAAFPATLFALRYPERVTHLVLQNPFLNGKQIWDAPNRRALLSLASIDWDLCAETLAWLTWPTGDREGLTRLAEYIAACINANDFLAMARCEHETDFTAELPGVRVPTLVLGNSLFSRMVPVEHSREAAAAIPDATYVSVQGPRERVVSIAGFLRDGSAESRIMASTRPEQPEGVPLSGREREVLRLIASGLSNREIAERLVVGTRTVDTHAASIYQKTGTRGRAEATAYAIRHGLLEDQ